MDFKVSLPCSLTSTLNRRQRRRWPFALQWNVWQLLIFVLSFSCGLGKPEDPEGQTFLQLKNTALKKWEHEEKEAIATTRKAIAKCTFNECVMLGEELAERWENSLKSVAMELTVEAYERALALMPHPEVSRRLGNIFLKLQRHNDSIPHFRAAINTGQKFAYINLHNMILYNSDLSAQLEVAKYTASMASKYMGPNLVRERTQYAYWLLIQGEFTNALMQLDFADKYVGKLSEFKFMGALLRCYCHLGLGNEDTASTWKQRLEQMMKTDLATVTDAMSWHNYYHFLPWYHIGDKVQQQMHMDRLQAGSRAPPMLADHFLPGFRVPEQLEELYQHDEQRLVEEGEAWWILKLMGGANAKGIRIETDLSRSGLEVETGLLVQQYVQSPFLLNGHKFKMRTYVVVTSALPLRAYLFDDGFLYLSTKAYHRDKAHVNDSDIHISGGQAKDFDAFPPLPIRTFRRMLREELNYSDEDIERMWRGIQRLSAGSLLSIQDVLAEHMQKMYPEKQREFTLPHILSFDVQLDANLQPWFIEVNPGGGLRTASKIKAPVLQELIHETWLMTIRRHHPRMPNTAPEVERRGSTAWVAHQLTEHGCKVADMCAPIKDHGCCFNTSEIADIAMAISEDTHRGVFQRLLPTFSTAETKHIGIEDSAFPTWMANSLLGIKLAAYNTQDRRYTSIFNHKHENSGSKHGRHEEL